ncbi:uncharacterized protein L969DRAFT_97471 [Mixia osmundae IAM 14324]|uniref:Response regulatory domain-containing protein n=1 Tax=Mixia osmundae (strain CBS 9802 / IAM 14324 / JCM 22182 / KY 12970) TaxID=764103 RepID=G7E4F3_MIXOS|nr:uncharacterized protein L969DRAFT_97471 [Mixia osmundae IAM 14324]KEI36269.1 hypothetical protein L969DRAFT_97471 [Mixia osmundae IAM 14324]GAA97713.1 hypothetical protein E5Q_04392 [Mixia osmundae IAM 14324]
MSSYDSGSQSYAPPGSSGGRHGYSAPSFGTNGRSGAAQAHTPSYHQQQLPPLSSLSAAGAQHIHTYSHAPLSPRSAHYQQQYQYQNTRHSPSVSSSASSSSKSVSELLQQQQQQQQRLPPIGQLTGRSPSGSSPSAAGYFHPGDRSFEGQMNAPLPPMSPAAMLSRPATNPPRSRSVSYRAGIPDDRSPQQTGFSSGQSPLGRSETRGRAFAGKADEEEARDDLDETPASVAPPSRVAAGPSEFVKKLFKMLEEGQYHEVVSWSSTGDSFLVKDMNSFTTNILPRHFKHSNFASFVRQLNKYDFHKVKSVEGEASLYGDHTWEFRHPDFRANAKHALDRIKRKGPQGSKASAAATNANGPSGALNSGKASPAPTPVTPNVNTDLENLITGGSTEAAMLAMKAQLDQLIFGQGLANEKINDLTREHQAVISELVTFQKNLVAQDALMQNLLQYLVTMESDKAQASAAAEGVAPRPYTPSDQTQRLISSYNEVARASFDQMQEITRRASLFSQNLPEAARHPHPPMNGSYASQPPVDPHVDPEAGKPAVRVVTLGQLRPRDGTDEYTAQDSQQIPNLTNPFSSDPQKSMEEPSASGERRGSTLRIRRGTYIPGWSVPPKVLLVEDDAVSRRLSSKFLQVFGCTIDVAVDGVAAVNKMNMDKYDLVLMDIVMPNLDGVSAASLIRQFDSLTPIISMTSNSNPNEILNYFSHGMNDILPKPFTKEGLLGMLEKHLIHLKQMQQLADIPRGISVGEAQIPNGLVSLTGSGDDKNNPFATMGIGESEYLAMLQGLVNVDSPNPSPSHKRHASDLPTSDDAKRGRFQEIETN